MASYMGVVRVLAVLLAGQLPAKVPGKANGPSAWATVPTWETLGKLLSMVETPQK